MFDLIIGNPPYQRPDGGHNRSAVPIYQYFCELAKRLKPQSIVMIIPARWFAGGKGGTSAFRESMIDDTHVRELHFFPCSHKVFKGIRIGGGVCYYRWDADYRGPVDFYSHWPGWPVRHVKKYLRSPGLDFVVVVPETESIIRKVPCPEPFSALITTRYGFGLRSDVVRKTEKYGLPPMSEEPVPGGLRVLGAIGNKRVFRYVPADYPLPNGQKFVGRWKVFVSPHLDNGCDARHERLKPIIGEPNDVCTESLLTVGPFEDRRTCENVVSYMDTKFFHLLLFAKKCSPHISAGVYDLVPVQDFSRPWTDEELYAKYNLSDEEIAFIEQFVCDKKEKK